MTEMEIINLTTRYAYVAFIAINLIIIGLLALFNIKTKNFFGWLAFDFLTTSIILLLINIFKNQLFNALPLDQAAAIQFLAGPLLLTMKYVAYVYAVLAVIFFIIFAIKKKRN